jgi:DNA-binding NtrC family response regulator
LLAYEWPGNVRELRNTVARLGVRGVSPLDAPVPGRPTTPHAHLIFDASGQPRPWLEVRRLDGAELEREYFQILLERTDGHQARAAELAQIRPQSLSQIVRRHGLGRGRR